ncbi:MAG: hypothetical protein AAGB51_02275 [Planctomycetota bacterium]
MNEEATGARFNEASAWIQLLGAVGPFAGALAVIMSAPQNAGLTFFALASATTLTVIIQIVLHMVAAIATKEEPDDERDLAISHAADRAGGYIVSVGLIMAALALYWQRWTSEAQPPESAFRDPILVGHFLVLTLVVSEGLRTLTTIYFYRRG